MQTYKEKYNTLLIFVHLNPGKTSATPTAMPPLSSRCNYVLGYNFITKPVNS